jgi:two-component system sensor histidine kinase HydH
MQILPRSKIFYVSPWLLAAATTLLVLIVVTFTLTNIRREEHLMTSAMLQKADTLIRIIHSGSKSAFFSDFRRDAWKIEAWQVYVQRIIQHVAEDPDVQFLAVIDDKNRIIAHNNEKIIGQHLDFVLPDNISEDQGKKPPLKYSITTNEGYGRVFEAVRLFFPYRPFMQPMMQNSFVRPLGRDPLAQQRMMLRKFHEKVDIEQLDSGTFYVLVGLDMSGYDQSLRRIKLQTLVLSLIMLLVGLGGWLSLAAVQGFRVSQKTLEEMKLFTSLLLAKLPVGIIASDNEGYITTCNDSAARMIGTSGNNLIGERVEAALPKPFSDFFVDIAQVLLKLQSPGLKRKLPVWRMTGNFIFSAKSFLLKVRDQNLRAGYFLFLISRRLKTWKRKCVKANVWRQ